MKRILTIILVLTWASAGYANEEITVDLPGGATMEMVWIEPGTFTMGASDWELGHSDGPQHEVTISRGFYLGKYEITQEQWETVMYTRPYEKKDDSQRYWRDNPKHPAILISWYDVQEFIRRLNDAEGSESYRLPTEAEWEYSCRAGTMTLWSFGDDESLVGDYAWFRENTFDIDPQEAYAHEVGTKLPNPWGLHDMHGNALEWTEDWTYGSYPGHAQLNPTGPQFGTSRVLRGGAYDRPPGDLRSAFRSSLKPDGLPGVKMTGARLVKQRSEDYPTEVQSTGWGEIKADH
jgi:formylglycine-generating enzyme required for sulfatase activity